MHEGSTLINPGRRRDDGTIRSAGFTLIELLVVIAIVAILAVVVVLVLNPAALVQQSRDGNRVSDMATLNTALGFYLTDAGVNGTVSLGSPNTVYVSIPDPSATSTAGDQCQGLGLPSLPANYSYHCAARSTYRLANGTGWIPVNFSGVSSGSPLGQLPVDPTNNSSSREYYAYATNGSQYEIAMVPESAKYQAGGANDVITGDGGTLASVYEKGTKLGLEPLDYGDPSLVGYWTMDEGSGSVAYDYSGSNATGSWQGSVVNGSHYVAGKVGGYAANFNGTNNYIYIPSPSSGVFDFAGTKAFTVNLWLNMASTTTDVLDKWSWSGDNGYDLLMGTGVPNFAVGYGNGTNGDVTAGGVTANAWTDFAFVFNGATLQGYENGVPSGSNAPVSQTIVYATTSALRFGYPNWVGYYLQGSMDDVRIYNRALTGAQVAALYNGGK